MGEYAIEAAENLHLQLSSSYQDAGVSITDEDHESEEGFRSCLEYIEIEESMIEADTQFILNANQPMPVINAAPIESRAALFKLNLIVATCLIRRILEELRWYETKCHGTVTGSCFRDRSHSKDAVFSLQRMHDIGDIQPWQATVKLHVQGSHRFHRGQLRKSQ